MRLGTIQTLHKKFWQWMKNQIAQDVPASDGLCEYDCRKQECTEEEWATCERRIQRAAGELWPDTKPAQTSVPPPKLTNYRSILTSQSASQSASQSEEEQALARLKCAHCQSLFNCEALAQAVLVELRRSRIQYRRGDEDDSVVTDPEFIEVVRRGVDHFLRDAFGSEDEKESCPPAA